MKFLSKKILLNFVTTLPILLCFACSQKPAQVLNRNKILYGHNNSSNKEKYKNFIKKDIPKKKETSLIKNSTPDKESIQSNSTSLDKTSKSSQITIVAGDTLLSIAKKYEVTLHDLIKQNNLAAPYNLKLGATLIIPAPNYHEVKKGDTLYSISRLYNMKVDDLTALNDLKEPYAVKLGEKIRIVKFIAPSNSIEQNNNPKETAASNAPAANNNDSTQVGFVEKISDKFNKFSWPIKGEVISQFGPKKGGLHNDGINIKAKDGSEVKAAEDGVVAYVGNELKGYGNLIIIKHSGGWITAYAHLKNSSVVRGQKIKQGEKIALVGTTGNVSSPQLYFGLRKGRDAVNPERYLK